MTFSERAILTGVCATVCLTAYLAVEKPTSGVVQAPKAELLLAMRNIDLKPEAIEISVAPLARPEKLSPAHTAEALDTTFERLGYDLERVSRGEDRVPRLFMASLPEDLKGVPETASRKAIFFRTVLPLILRANEEILEDRHRLWRLVSEKRLGRKLKAEDRLWLRALTERYGVSAGDFGTLLARVDVIPPSLALAQSAEESGWGTSRFARQGNAIFGQWTFKKEKGLVPLAREQGKTHRVKAFDRLIDSVRAYMLNLNSHKAYKGLRRERAAMRRSGRTVDGYILAGHLTKYSQRGQAYVTGIRGLISHNRLRRLDEARLIGPQPPSIPLRGRRLGTGA